MMKPLIGDTDQAPPEGTDEELMRPDNLNEVPDEKPDEEPKEQEEANFDYDGDLIGPASDLIGVSAEIVKTFPEP